MAKDIADKFLDLALRQRLIFDRLENNITRDAIKLLKENERDIKAKIRQVDPTEPVREAAKRRRLENLLKETRANIHAGIKSTGRAVQLELQDAGLFAGDMFSQEIADEMPFPWTAKSLTGEQMRSIIREQPIDGQLYDEWFGGLSESTSNRLGKELRLGLVNGESIPQMVSRASAVYATSTRHLTTIIRTATNHVVNKSREQVIQNNSDIISGYIWSATLDTRTSHICRVNDGRFYKIDDPSRPSLPAHPNCRSAWTPKIKSFKEIGSDLKELPPVERVFNLRVPDNNWNKTEIRRWLTRQGEPAPGKPPKGSGQRDLTKDELLARTKAVTDKYGAVLKGRVPDRPPFSKWIKEQPRHVIVDIYGPTRAGLIDTGLITTDDLESRSGGFIKLKDLKKLVEKRRRNRR